MAKINGVKYTDNSDVFLKALDKQVNNWLEEASGEIEAQAKRTTNTDTGQLKGSWTHKVDKNAKEALVGSPLQNAIWNEYGTGEHALEGKGRKTPWYVPVDDYKGTKKPTFNGKVVIVYSKNGKAFYKTNGKKPQRTLEEAFKAKENVLKKRLKELLGGVTK